MRRASSFLLGAFAVLGSAESVDFRFMTYNIRYAAENPTGGEKPWSIRRPLMAGQLDHEVAGRPDSLLCFQEALQQQVEDLNTDLGDAWKYVGVGRDDGDRAGEFSPIFYQPAEWELKRDTTYWLSETPHEVGSVGWDAALPRIATVAQFQHQETGTPLVYICTHFDHQGQVAREKSAELLVAIAEKWSSDNSSVPVFLGGDLNVDPENAAYETLATELNDVRDVVPVEKHSGHNMTFTGFDSDTSNDSQIDHLFVKEPSGIEWVSFAVLNTLFDNEIFISDHRPVVADVKLPVKVSGKALRRVSTAWRA